jgi:septation ring formation regulator EzrA
MDDYFKATLQGVGKLEYLLDLIPHKDRVPPDFTSRWQSAIANLNLEQVETGLDNDKELIEQLGPMAEHEWEVLDGLRKQSIHTTTELKDLITNEQHLRWLIDTI